MFEDAEYSFDIIRKELSLKWKNLWREIEKLRFELNPKEAFQKLQVVTKYHAFEKRDGSIISKVNVDGATVQSPEQVNLYLKQSLQNLCGNDQTSTLTKCTIFPHLQKLTIIELRQIVTRLSKKKALAEDFCEDSVLWENILKDNKIAEYFTHLWDSNNTNTEEFQRHLTGRLVPLNKVHPEIPKPDEMRPIIALSPILKLVESRFREKLENYMTERMNPCQVGFVRECGTHVNIVRLIRRCLSTYANNQKKFKPKAILFIDFKSTHNKVNLDMFFKSLEKKKILENDEIVFMRTSLETNLTIA